DSDTNGPFGPFIVDWAFETRTNTAIRAGWISSPVACEAVLSGANEVPANNSTHSGTGTFQLENFIHGSKLSWSVGLDASFRPTDAGIFGPASPSLNSW